MHQIFCLRMNSKVGYHHIGKVSNSKYFSTGVENSRNAGVNAAALVQMHSMIVVSGVISVFYHTVV